MTKNSSGGKSPAITLWIIAGLYLSMMIMYIVVYLDRYSGINDTNSFNLSKMLMLPVAWTVLLVVEGILLWKFSATVNRPQAWIHVACMFVCFVLSFLFTLVATIYITSLHGAGDAANKFQMIYKVNQYGFWAFFIVGHIFFISIIVQRFANKNKIKADEPSSGILDEFAD